MKSAIVAASGFTAGFCGALVADLVGYAMAINAAVSSQRRHGTRCKRIVVVINTAFVLRLFRRQPLWLDEGAVAG
jgi:uncharacterized membrane protein